MSPTELKVLVVDDEPAVLQALGVLFELHGVPSLGAASPDEALRQLGSANVGVVIQDMNFGTDKTSGEEGIRLFHRIREVDPDVPVLLMTAWASLETAVQLIKEGANDYLAKPWDDDKLVVTVNTLLKLRRLQLENDRLQRQRQLDRQALAEGHDLCGVVYESDELHQPLIMALNVAASDAPVLIGGPSGSGKEKLAEIVQANSRRRERPFLKVNVGALPEELMESELFGAEAGAYTGATSLRIGRFEAADGGTLFLDEIDALSLAGQVKLLRVVQSGEFQRLGSSKPRRVDVRIISATNSNIEQAVARGSFREDLFYRLNVIQLRVPPLAERRDDILPLARHFLAVASRAEGGEPRTLGPEAEQTLLRHTWGGNVRELENCIRRATLIAAGNIIEVAELDLVSGAPGQTGTGGESAGSGDVERIRIEQALLDAGGIVARAADRLGLSRQALYRKMDKLGIVMERRPR